MQVFAIVVLLAAPQSSVPSPQPSVVSPQSSVLSPQSSPKASDEITVTATRKESKLSDTPSSVVVLDREALNTTPSTTVDDALRQVPGFTLFRRSGSRSANPTAQGVSLRGIGASGA